MGKKQLMYELDIDEPVTRKFLTRFVELEDTGEITDASEEEIEEYLYKNADIEFTIALLEDRIDEFQLFKYKEQVYIGYTINNKTVCFFDPKKFLKVSQKKN